MQKKDIIYIDVEDDITAIIGKIKESKEKIVALVPPKRVGVLQSAVNLRLLARTANNEKKRLVVITHNAALSSLAASANIPVAKTLQSRPELVEPPSVDDNDEDVIDGSGLSVGDHAGMPPDDSDDDDIIEGEEKPTTRIDDIDIDGESTSVKKPATKEPGKKSRISVPDFGSFRKRLTIGIAAGVLLIGFFVWAIWFAPHATVVVTARTSDVEIQTPITIGENVELDNEAKALPSVVETEKQEDTVEFKPTGQKEVGEKASGTVKFYNCRPNPNPVTIPAGTYLSDGSKNYILQSTVTVPPPSFGSSTVCTPSHIDPGVSGDVKIVAEEIGSDFNVSEGVNFEVAGTSDVIAIASSDISGGSKETITVVSAEDVQKAREELAEDKTEEVKELLREKFDDNVVIIEESFRTTVGDQKIEPGIGEEVTGDTATITIEMVYNMSGIIESILDNFLETAIAEQLGNLDDKRIYESGAKNAEMTDFEVGSDKKKATIQLSATGKVGPKIDDNEIKEIVRGKRYGEIEAELKSIDGVSDVAVNLSPFWVFTVPDDNNKITIEFKLLEDDN